MRREATPSDMQSYSAIEAAALLHVHRATVLRWISAGKLPAYNIGPPNRPRLRITEDALRKFIADRHINVSGGAA